MRCKRIMHCCYKSAHCSALRGTTSCRASKCARLTRQSGLLFYSYCGESSRIFDFSCFHASMPGGGMSMNQDNASVSTTQQQHPYSYLRGFWFSMVDFE